MKLPKVSARLILGTAVAAIVMIMALWWVLLLLGPRLEFELYRPIEWGLFVILLILQIGCLLFFVRDIYIHGVTKKHPRVTIAARVLGALGASGAFSYFLLFSFFFPITPIPVGLFMSLMAIIGVKLALARSKVAGVLMLLAGMMPWIHWLGVIFLFDVFGLQWRIVFLVGVTTSFTLPASLPLIPGGVLTLVSARRKQPGNRVIVAFIVIPLIAFIASVIYILQIIPPIP